MTLPRAFNTSVAAVYLSRCSLVRKRMTAEFHSGEHTRLACWFRRLAETNFIPFLSAKQHQMTQEEKSE